MEGNKTYYTQDIMELPTYDTKNCLSFTTRYTSMDNSQSTIAEQVKTNPIGHPQWIPYLFYLFIFFVYKPVMFSMKYVAIGKNSCNPTCSAQLYQRK